MNGGATRERGEVRTLFEGVDVGFCVIEVLFGDDGRAEDYRLLEVNPAFVQQTRLLDAVGTTIDKIAPNHDSHWFETTAG